MNKTEEIYPLNLQGSYRNKFYRQALNHVLIQLTPYVIIPHKPRATRHFAARLSLGFGGIQRLADLIAKHPVLAIPGVKLEVYGNCGSVEEMPFELSELVTDAMIECSVDGIFPSASFMELGAGGIWSTEYSETRLGMFCMQNWLTRTGSSNPNNHREVLVTPACAEVYREEIGDVFGCGHGAWTPDIERLLTPCQVALRAWMLGEDPIQALDAFRELPAANLLEYLHTMPERTERYDWVRSKGRKVKK